MSTKKTHFGGRKTKRAKKSKRKINNKRQTFKIISKKNLKLRTIKRYQSGGMFFGKSRKSVPPPIDAETVRINTQANRGLPNPNDLPYMKLMSAEFNEDAKEKRREKLESIIPGITPTKKLKEELSIYEGVDRKYYTPFEKSRIDEIKKEIDDRINKQKQLAQKKAIEKSSKDLKRSKESEIRTPKSEGVSKAMEGGRKLRKRKVR